MIGLIVVIGLVVLLVGLLAGIVAGHFLILPADRRRLEVMTDQLIFEIRQDAATRSTIAEMRRVAREQNR